MTIVNDRRTPEQLKTHRYLVTGTDRFLSGWGMAQGGLSKCAWACETREQAERKADEVRKRGDVKHVHIHFGSWRPRAAHVSIYVAKD